MHVNNFYTLMLNQILIYFRSVDHILIEKVSTITLDNYHWQTTNFSLTVIKVFHCQSSRGVAVLKFMACKASGERLEPGPPYYDIQRLGISFFNIAIRLK